MIYHYDNAAPSRIALQTDGELLLTGHSAVGADTDHGGWGVDTLSYADADQGVTVDMSTGTGPGRPRRSGHR